LTILFIGSIVLAQGNIISDNSFTVYDEVLAGKDKLITMVPVAGGLSIWVALKMKRGDEKTKGRFMLCA
jgi:hypothetical protein